jgi:hypothetical protein
MYIDKEKDNAGIKPRDGKKTINLILLDRE